MECHSNTLRISAVCTGVYRITNRYQECTHHPLISSGRRTGEGLKPECSTNSEPPDWEGKGVL